MRKIQKPGDKKIAISANEARLDRFIDNFPYQIAEDLKNKFRDLKKGATNTETIKKAVLQQIEQACKSIELRLNEIKKIS